MAVDENSSNGKQLNELINSACHPADVRSKNPISVGWSSRAQIQKSLERYKITQIRVKGLEEFSASTCVLVDGHIESLQWRWKWESWMTNNQNCLMDLLIAYKAWVNYTFWTWIHLQFKSWQWCVAVAAVCNGGIRQWIAVGAPNASADLLMLEMHPEFRALSGRYTLLKALATSPSSCSALASTNVALLHKPCASSSRKSRA